MTSLVSGERIPTLGDPVEVVSFIAEGGQGEVYKVRYKGKMYALKWYKSPVPPQAFYDNLASNVKRGAPNKRFLWPLMVTKRYKGSYGYVMELRPDRYCEFSEFLLDKVRFPSYELMIKAALNMVRSFRVLHSLGFSYQDVNEGGFFICPTDGDVLICDNDNVAPFGVNLGVKGFPRYMAPEVVTDRCRPNSHTDRFSLAVLLFRLFYIDHPLEGKYTVNIPMTDSLGAHMFGESPVFCYDPHNDRNRPVPNVHTNVINRWNMYPPDLPMAFTRAFTKGMKDINFRVTDLEWEEILVKVRGMLVKIHGKEQFVNVYAKQRIPDSCRFLKLPEYIVVLGDGTKLYDCHTNRFSADYDTVTGEVGLGSSVDTLELRNKTNNVWKVTTKDGQVEEISPRSVIRLAPGMTIDFDGTEGKIY